MRGGRGGFLLIPGSKQRPIALARVGGYNSGRRLRRGPSRGDSAHRIGLGLVSPLVCLWGLWCERANPAVRTLGLTALTLFVIVTWLPRYLPLGLAQAHRFEQFERGLLEGTLGQDEREHGQRVRGGI